MVSIGKVFIVRRENMKKLAFSLFAAAFAFGISADSEIEDQVIDAQDQIEKAFDGFYGAFGIHVSEFGVKTETGNVGTANLGDAGVDTNDHSTDLGGTIALGFGKKVKTCAFCAIEAGLDIRKTKHFVHAGMMNTGGRIWEVTNKVNGFIPSLSFVIGYIEPQTKVLSYLKLGAAYSKSTTYYEESPGVNQNFGYGRSVSKICPIVALGIARPFSNKSIARLEVEYRFKANNTLDFVSPFNAQYKGTVKATNKDSITFRLMFVRNLHHFGN